MYRVIALILALVAAVAGLLFGTLNPDPLPLDFLFTTVTVPSGAALLGAFAGGVICGLLIAWLLFWLPARLRRKDSNDDRGR